MSRRPPLAKPTRSRLIDITANYLNQRIFFCIDNNRTKRYPKTDGGFMSNATIQIHTDAEIKAAADSIFARLGITMSDGINIFLRQVQIHQGFPFEVRLNRQPSVAENGGQSVEERLAHIRSLRGKFKDCTFSSERLFENRRRDRELEK
jgi:DNA-damage-inducible protein J